MLDAETEGWPDRENQGYLGLSVEAQWKMLRRDQGVLHVQVTICLDEGQPKRLKNIEIRHVGSQSSPPVLDSDDLRKEIPLNDGEIYNQDKFYIGVSAVSRAYANRGFMDCTVNIEMQLDRVNQTVALVLDITEGSQYRWVDILVIGLDPKLEAILKSKLETGRPANPKLVRDFYQEYKSALPVDASPETVRWQSDVQRSIVNLTFDFRTPHPPAVHN